MMAGSGIESKHARERVLEFEVDLDKRLCNLTEIEQNIVALGQMRSRWLTSVSNIDEVETEAYHLRLETLRAHAELSTMNIELDRAKLDSQYEAQALNYLVAATKPLDAAETPEIRNRALTILARDNLENLRIALKESVDYRSKLARRLHEMTGSLAKYRVDHDNRHRAVVDELQERIQLYAERMREAVSMAKKQHQKITGEYLLLRHNARVAKEVLVRNQNEASMARKILQEKLEKLVEEAARQRERMETAAEAEKKIMTDDIRSEVIRKEQEVNHLRTRIELLDSSRKSTYFEIKRDLRKYEKKYDALQEKRQSEITDLAAELKMLRDMVAKVEVVLYQEDVEDNLFFNQHPELAASLESDILKQFYRKTTRPPPPPVPR